MSRLLLNRPFLWTCWYYKFDLLAVVAFVNLWVQIKRWDYPV